MREDYRGGKRWIDRWVEEVKTRAESHMKSDKRPDEKGEKKHDGDRIEVMIGWMMGEERSSATDGERMRAQTGTTEGEAEKWGKGKQVKTKRRKRKRETDAGNGSQRNHSRVTGRPKHGEMDRQTGNEERERKKI